MRAAGRQAARSRQWPDETSHRHCRNSPKARVRAATNGRHAIFRQAPPQPLMGDFFLSGSGTNTTPKSHTSPRSGLRDSDGDPAAGRKRRRLTKVIRVGRRQIQLDSFSRAMQEKNRETSSAVASSGGGCYAFSWFRSGKRTSPGSRCASTAPSARRFRCLETLPRRRPCSVWASFPRSVLPARSPMS